MGKVEQPKYGEDWKTIPMVYLPVTEQKSHCPFCLHQVDSYQTGDYPDTCKCGIWYDGRYKKAQTQEEQKAEQARVKKKAAAIRKKRERAIYERVKKELETELATEPKGDSNDL